jgi:aminoglycoside phosphotransferase (APT) family kinase protein
LALVPALNGESYSVDSSGAYWRTYHFIEGAQTYDTISDPRQSYEAAKAFGRFQKDLADLPGPPLFETIPGFHDTVKRIRNLEAVIGKDSHGRGRTVKAQIDFVVERQKQAGKIVDWLTEGQIPTRVTHNDTKLNNVMLDNQTGAGICVIDLDTVMSGSALYDFGDSVRLGAATAGEDETDLTQVGVSLEMFAQLARGYLESAAEFLTPLEKENLVFASWLMTFECGVRFLTDYIEGDVYFRTHRPGHNLERCRNQFKMVAEIERHWDKLEQLCCI